MAANALIEILTKSGNRFVTYEDLEKYGEAVVNILQEKDEKVVLILSRESTRVMFRNYSNIFEDANNGISLKEGVEISDLITQFRGYLAWDVLLALIDNRALSALKITRKK
ncbi:MAG: hypothetical protein LBQ98_05200 [Nitrososphaerota archaeon]|nr:hypothetical protein [Nitrososphaerota archaeon]